MYSSMEQQLTLNSSSSSSSSNFQTKSSRAMREAFRILTLSLLLPLSFLLLSRLSTAQYLISVSDNYPTPPPKFFLWSFLLHSTKPTILHLILSIISVSSLTNALAAKTTFSPQFPNLPLPRRRLHIAWIFLFLLQICVGAGIEGSIAAGIEGSGFGHANGFLCRAVFFLGLHETMLFWARTVVKPVVDDTIFGGWRAEGRLEKVALGLSYGGLWWWRLREEVEALVMVPEVKREMMMGIGVADFVGWWLYYLTVTIGMVRLIRDFVFTVAILTRRRRGDGPTRPNDDKV